MNSASFISTCKIQQNFYSKMRLVGLIKIHLKEKYWAAINEKGLWRMYVFSKFANAICDNLVVLLFGRLFLELVIKFYCDNSHEQSVFKDLQCTVPINRQKQILLLIH